MQLIDTHPRQISETSGNELRIHVGVLANVTEVEVVEHGESQDARLS
jgi:hypothetical protein